MQGRTTIVVAHRLSTIRDVNLISVLQCGKWGPREGRGPTWSPNSPPFMACPADTNCCAD
ncbi:hypothetical protein Sjap_009928 [Stephania japonica]|uniref:Uncharacterized protein n=1 Tax=Stephania japonica TaxID=461633 RepID=A0AAP0J8J9_9MAGN